MLQTWRWKDVLRVRGARAGAVGLAISAIDAGLPRSWTASRCGSLRVIWRQRVPPHHGPGACGALAEPAATADAHAAAPQSVARRSGVRRAGIGECRSAPTVSRVEED